MAYRLTVFLAVLCWISAGSSVMMGMGYVLNPNRIDLFFLSLFFISWAMSLGSAGILNEKLEKIEAKK